MQAIMITRTAADNLWVPPPTFLEGRAAAADNLSARSRCRCCCVVFGVPISMTKKGYQKSLRIERNSNPTTSGLFALVQVPSLVKGEGSASFVLASIAQTLEILRH